MINQKQFNLIESYIKENKGATIFLGYVFHMVEAVYIEFMDFNSGYIVSYKGGIKIPQMDLTRKTINDFLMNNLEKIRGGANYLGLWINPNNNHLYIDISVKFDSIHNALDIARFNDQLYIYDCKKKQSLNTWTMQYE